ncbi:winged helix-turn-helix domain-containing protein [Marinobacter salinisoli]|uniref:Winged helix-turn-helix domain-containing protein n=1 Tax=Marinobacter salinisoli TaxID=2769486 RepID=A0ABX7MXG7_9GAMM|nr:winged helix-turn-helix domain-containing protein [Marinobacter salinisoli]QSP94893.1 winged helix-turn-helix domain-containing protein [Marinobacter salinisoli]
MPASVYRFGNFRLDLARHELLCDNRPVAVEPQVFSVLKALIENRERTVAKDDLMAMVWPGRVVSDSALSSRIKSARHAIGDDGKAQALIKTIHGFGFRFVGEVVEDDVRPSTGGCADQRPSIVVLPFTLLGNDVKQAVLSQGLAHDIITGLSRLRWLKVIARASAFRLTAAGMSYAEMHRLTHARYCLAGCLEIDGKELAINFELIDMAAESVLWAERITGSLDDVHEVRSDIVTRTIAAFELQISAHEVQRAKLKSPDNLDTWESYHLGISHLFRFTEKDNQAATTLFRRAVELEPGFARAHAGLSAAEFQNAFNAYKGVDRDTSVRIARESAERSIELDSLDPMANFVMGRTHWLSGDPTASLPWLERAVALNPNYAQGYYAHGLASLMASEELRGYQDSEQAVSLSPLDPFLYGFYGIRAFSYIADGDVANARLWAVKAACQPGAIPVMDLLAAATCAMDGASDQAETWLRKARGRKPDIDSDYFFRALQFSPGVVRQRIQAAFSRLGL